MEVSTVGRGALREYVRGSLWVLPGLSALAALAAGAALSSISVGPRSPLAFQGTPDDARTLLLGITGTVITIIALLLGLAVVALQLSSTQFSPRLLRNYLGDRPTGRAQRVRGDLRLQRGGLYRVGVSGGNRTAPSRLAVSGAIVLLFASLGLLVFFADHLLHSIQVDAIMETVQRNTLAVIEDGLLTGAQEAPEAPAWAVPVLSRHSGYVQAVRPGESCCRAPPGTACACACGPGSASTSWPGRRWPGSGETHPPTPPRTRRPSPGSWTAGSGWVRADRGAGRRLRDPAARRRGVQGAVPGGQRPVHRGPGRRSPVSDLLRAGPAAAGPPTSPARPGDRDRPGPAVRRLPRGDVRADPPLRGQRADRRRTRCSGCSVTVPPWPETTRGHRAAIAEQVRIIVSDTDREVAQPADLDFTHAEAESVLQAVAGHPPGEPRAPPRYAGRRIPTRPAAVSSAPAAIISSHGAGLGAGVARCRQSRCWLRPRHDLAAHRVGHGVDLQPGGVVKHHDGVNRVRGAA